MPRGFMSKLIGKATREGWERHNEKLFKKYREEGVTKQFVDTLDILKDGCSPVMAFGVVCNAHKTNGGNYIIKAKNTLEVVPESTLKIFRARYLNCKNRNDGNNPN